MNRTLLGSKILWRPITLVIVMFCTPLSYANTNEIEKTSKTEASLIHFLIPGSKGGGWDTTARETGKALLSSKQVGRVYFENFVGAGGGRALMDLVNNPDKHTNTLMVQSTPLLLRNLTGVIDLGYRDIIPISILIAEYQVLVVPIDSPFNTVADLVKAIANSPVRNPVLGGSSLGSLDHVTLALIAQAGQLPISKLRYVPTNGGGDAMSQLKRGIGVALVTGLGEALEEYSTNKIKILGITSRHRLESLPETPTFNEQGFNVEFANWRGFFASKFTHPDKIHAYKRILSELSRSDHWQEIRQIHQWEPLLVQGEALNLFLEAQETKMRQALSNLGIE